MKGFFKTAYPPGAPILPNLLRLQGLEVYEYICSLAALHLRQTRRLQDLGGIFCDLPTGEHCPLRIPVLRKKRPEDLAAASPIEKSQKYEALPPVTKKGIISCVL